MNHAFEITKDHVMKITIPEDKDIFFVIVKSPNQTEVFAHSFKVKENLRRAVAEYLAKNIEKELLDENRDKS